MSATPTMTAPAMIPAIAPPESPLLVAVAACVCGVDVDVEGEGGYVGVKMVVVGRVEDGSMEVGDGVLAEDAAGEVVNEVGAEEEGEEED